MVVDRTLKIVFANAAAERLMCDALCVHQGRLAASSRQQQDAFVRFATSALRPGHYGDTPVIPFLRALQ